MGAYYRAVGGIIRPTKRLKNSPTRYAWVALLIAIPLVISGFILEKATRYRFFPQIGILSGIAALFVVPAYFFRRGKTIEFNSLGIGTSAEEKNQISAVQITHFVLVLGNKPKPPGVIKGGQPFVPTNQRIGPAAFKVRENATFHYFTATLKDGRTLTQHFALNHPKDYESLLQIMKQWQAAGVEVSIRRKTES